MTPLRPLVAPLVAGLAGALLLSAVPAVTTAATAAPDRGTASGTSSTGTRGSWAVDDLGDGTRRLRWTSPTPLPVGDARPHVRRTAADGTLVDLGPARVGADGRTVAVTVPAGPDDLRLDRLDVLLSGRVLDDPAATARRGAPDPRAGRTAGSSAAPAPTDPGPVLPVDPGVPGDLRVVRSDYTEPSIRVPGMKAPVEVVGHVVEPAPGQLADAPPLVVLLHGRHSYCYLVDAGDEEGDDGSWPCADGSLPVPSQLGYDYLQRVLASQGYATVSIAANGINAQDGWLPDGGADARSRLVRHHLDLWASRAWTGTVPAGSRVADLSRVVLVGHSRGGEGVSRAAQEIGLDAPYRVVGQVLVAPVQFARQTAAYVPTMTLLPSCDGDVSDLQGAGYADVWRGLAPDDTALHATVTVLGANHNYFNSQWTPGPSIAPAWDDWSGSARSTCGTREATRLTAREQRAVGTAYVAGAVQLFAAEADATTQAPAGSTAGLRTMFDGTRGHVASAGDAVVLSTDVGSGRALRVPGAPGAAVVAAPGVRQCAGYQVFERPRDGSEPCLVDETWGRAPHWPVPDLPGLPTRDAAELTWTSPGRTLGLAGTWDLSGSDALDLRVVVDPLRPQPTVVVRLTDGSGRTADLAPAAPLVRFPGSPSTGLAKLVGQTLRVDPSAAALGGGRDGTGGVDLTDVRSVAVVARSSAGRLWVLDVAARPTGAAPAVPATRLPQLDLGTVTVDEGDGPGTAAVPWHLSAPLAQPATVVVGRASDTARSGLRPLVLRLPAGTTRGTVPVRFTGDDRYGQRRRGTYLAAWAVAPATSTDATTTGATAVMPRRWTGRAVIREDDPRPRVTLGFEPAVVREGDVARLVVRLSEPLATGAYVEGVFVAGRGPRADATDLAPWWVQRHLYFEGKDRQLYWNGYQSLSGELGAGRRSVVLDLPTRRDGRAERDERVSVRVRIPGVFGSDRVVVRTLTIRDR